ncbi:hypothetical protein AHIS1636_09120 [Arthrobacter mangrovi]|uniref:Uncharacterized protein n=1 Tax=Arthrobacter mangrovi TaxID=2966350 RepID=A0ABQ5MR88_9MICC|nr:hypothetical protein AHIS1636_09120 [Arthrobacter mangrovi]
MAGAVGELDALTKHGAGLRDGSGPKLLEDLCAQAFEARLLCKDVEGRQWKLLQLIREIRGEDTSRRYRAGVDPHYPVDKLRASVQDEADGSVSPTVGDENRRLITLFSNDAQNCFSLGVEGSSRTLRIVCVETRQCHRDGTRVVGFQVFKNFVPGPGTQPVAGDEDDRRAAHSSCHVPTLAGRTDNGMSLFMS